MNEYDLPICPNCGKRGLTWCYDAGYGPKEWGCNHCAPEPWWNIKPVDNSIGTFRALPFYKRWWWLLWH